MKNTKIAAASQQSPMGALLLPADTPLAEAIGRFASDPTLHGIFLVDNAGRLAGVINNHDLLDWARRRRAGCGRRHGFPGDRTGCGCNHAAEG